ncbi:MAG TPA: acyl-CoA synthetase [Acidimicrobiales bacterium]|nr:acyl-CoA synthetase [Acidimicrobiales bacterium]
MEFNLADLFERVADTVGHREALVSGDRRLTYAVLDERSTRLASGLAGLGVRAGDHVGLYLYNGAEFVETMLACFKLRAVPVNVNYRYVGEELAHLFSDADLVALVHDAELAPRVASLSGRPGSLRSLIEVDDGSGADAEAFGALRYEQVLASGSASRSFGPRSADDHYVLYTGGTTGLPKGVVWRQEDILFATLGGGNPGGPPLERPEEIGQAALLNRSHRIAPFLPPGDPGPDEFVALSLGPLIHASGQWTALSTLLGGGKLVLYTRRSVDMRRVLGLVETERVTMLTIVGDTSGRPLVEALEDRPGAFDTSSLRLLGSGGSILTAAIKDRLLVALPSVLAISEAVGSSEAPVQATAIAVKGKPASSLSFASRDVTMVLGDDLRPVSPGSGEIGRLATRGRGPIGYHKDPARTARTFVEIDGVRWSLPGDMATVEADGTIRLLGRGSMCINTGGEKVYPEEVEAVIKAHPRVADAVVVGADDPEWGQRVVCVVQASPEGAPALEDLRTHCRAHLAGYKAPRALYLVDEVRRSPAGKPDYVWASAVVAGAP